MVYITPYHPQRNSITERMYRTLKSVLACLYNGYPLRWGKILPHCQATMNIAVHTTGQQPYYAFFSLHPPRFINCELPSIDGTDEGISEVYTIVKDTHLKMARRYRAAVNKARKNKKVSLGKLMWVKTETT